MDRSIVCPSRGRWLPAILLSLICGSAGGATLPGYSVTDLGPGQVNPSTDGAGRGVVVGANGTTYDFPVTSHALSQSQAQPILAGFPPMTNAPVWSPMTYGNPNFAFSYLNSGTVFLNDRGELAVTNWFGVDGHTSGSGSTELISQRQADGTFGPLTPLWTSDGNGVNWLSGSPSTAIALNNQGQLLGTWSLGSTTRSMLHDVTTGQTTDVQNLLPTGWHLDRAVALDDLGRILVSASAPDASGFWTSHSLLLTPDAVTVPEPSTLATIVVGAAGLAIRRRQQRRARDR